MIDSAAAAALLTSGAVLLPSLAKVMPDIDTKEILTRTGTRIVAPEERSLLAQKIARANLKISPEYFSGIKAFLAGLVLLLCIPLSFISANYLCLIIFAPIFYFLPDYILNSKIKARQTAIKKSLSEFTMLFSVTLQAGTDTFFSIREASNAIGGPLKEEIDRAVKDHLAGKPLVDALYDMSRRVDVDELTSLVRTLSQVYSQGGSPAETMQSYSDQMRVVKKYENMEIAGKLSVKMLIPVLLFILVPCMLAIGFPAVYTLLQAF